MISIMIIQDDPIFLFYASSSNPFGLAQGWKDMSTVLSGSPKYGMHIYLETTASPVSAVISASSQNICEGDQVQFNASLSTNDYL